MAHRRWYATDLTGREWALLAPLFPPAKPGGRPSRAGGQAGRAAPLDGSARGAQGPELLAAQRRGVAPAAARLPALEDTLPLLARLAPQRGVGADPRGPARADAPARRPRADAPARASSTAHPSRRRKGGAGQLSRLRRGQAGEGAHTPSAGRDAGPGGQSAGPPRWSTPRMSPMARAARAARAASACLRP